MTRLSVSSLAWPADREKEAFQRLVTLGVAGVEIAPTRLAPWDAMTPSLLTDYRGRIEAAGLKVSSLQAILFGRDDVHLLRDAAAFRRLQDHMHRVSDVAATLGGGVMVFGSPRNRSVGDLPAAEAWALGCERFAVLGQIAADRGIVLGLEPVPRFYGGDFLTSWQDVLRMTEEVDSPGIRVHLDTGCVHLGEGSIAEAIAASKHVLAHFHAAQPNLSDFANPLPNHTDAAEALRRIGYDRWVAIEMREQADDPLAAIETAVRTVKRIYQSNP